MTNRSNRFSFIFEYVQKTSLLDVQLSYLHTIDYLPFCLIRVVLHTGHVPVKDPHHSAVFCLHAGEEVGPLPVALPALPHGWSHSGAGTSRHTSP